MDPPQQPNHTEENGSENPDGTNNENSSNSRRRPIPYDRSHIRQDQNMNSSSTNNMNASVRSRSPSFESPITLNTNVGSGSTTSAVNVMESTAGASTISSLCGPGTSASSSGTGSSLTFDADTRPFSFGAGTSSSPSGANTGGSIIGTGSNISLFGSHASLFGTGSHPSLFGATTRTIPTVRSDSFLVVGNRARNFAAGTSTANSGIRNRRHSISAFENINNLDLDNFIRPRQPPYDRNPIIHIENVPHLENNMRPNIDGDPERPLQPRRSIYTPLRIPYNRLPQRVEPERPIRQNSDDSLLSHLNLVLPPYTRRPATARTYLNAAARMQPPPNDHASRLSATNNVVSAVARVQTPPSLPPPDAEDENMDNEPGPSTSQI